MASFVAIKRLGFAGISSYVELIGSFVVSAIVARSLGPDDYGAYTFLIWLSGITIAFSKMGVGNAAIKFVAEARGLDDVEQLAGVRRRLGRIQLMLIAVALLILLGLAPVVFLPRIPEVYAPAIWFLVVASAAKAMYMLHLSVAKGMEYFGAVAQVAMITLPVQLALVGWAAWQDQGVMVFIAIYTAVSILSLLLMRWRVARANPAPAKALDGTTRRRMNRHLVLVSLANLVHILGRQKIEIFFLSLYSTQASIGYFAMAHSVTRAAREMLPGVMSLTIFPLLARTSSAAPQLLGARLLSTMRYMFFLGAPVSILGVELARPLILTIFGESYEPAIAPLKLFLGVVIIGSFSAPAISYLQSIDKQNINLFAGVVGAILNITLDLVLIPRYGLMGAALAASITSISLGVFVTIIMIRLARIRLPLGVGLRLACAGGIAVLPVHFLSPDVHSLVELVLDSLLFFALYVPLTILFGCWTRKDLRIFARLLGATRLPARGLRGGLLTLARKHPYLPQH